MNNSDDAFEERPETAVVYVCGEVAAPGVYTLPAQARIGEAVSAAGGFLDTAEDTWLNLAEIVTDGMRIYVPSSEEVREWKEGGSVEGTLTPGQKEAFQAGQDAGAGPAESSGKININTASADELMELNGIGESKAQSIIRYRDENGPFQDISEIMNIPGIKEGVFNRISGDISV